MKPRKLEHGFRRIGARIPYTLPKRAMGILMFQLSGFYCKVLNPTLTYQNLLFCRVPINSILGFIIRTYKKIGFGSLR